MTVFAYSLAADRVFVATDALTCLRCDGGGTVPHGVADKFQVFAASSLIALTSGTTGLAFDVNLALKAHNPRPYFDFDTLIPRLEDLASRPPDDFPAHLHILGYHAKKKRFVGWRIDSAPEAKAIKIEDGLHSSPHLGEVILPPIKDEKVAALADRLVTNGNAAVERENAERPPEQRRCEVAGYQLWGTEIRVGRVIHSLLNTYPGKAELLKRMRKHA